MYFKNTWRHLKTAKMHNDNRLPHSKTISKSIDRNKYHFLDLLREPRCQRQWSDGMKLEKNLSSLKHYSMSFCILEIVTCSGPRWAQRKIFSKEKKSITFSQDLIWIPVESLRTFTKKERIVRSIETVNVLSILV